VPFKFKNPFGTLSEQTNENFCLVYELEQFHMEYEMKVIIKADFYSFHAVVHNELL